MLGMNNYYIFDKKSHYISEFMWQFAIVQKHSLTEKLINRFLPKGGPSYFTGVPSTKSARPLFLFSYGSLSIKFYSEPV